MDQVPASPDRPHEPRPPGSGDATGPAGGATPHGPGRPPGASGSGGAAGPPPQHHAPMTCYRHPGRETGIRCTRCDRPICTDCMVNASVGYQCPECARSEAHSVRATRPRTVVGGPLASTYGLVTKVLIGINLVVFLASLADQALVAHLELIGRAVDPGSFQVVGVAEGEWWRLLTAVFLHQEIPHIALNMLSLWWIGPSLEAALGRVRYLALYLLAGLGGSALSYLLAAQNQPSLGASGAIFGLLGATAVLMRRLGQDMRPVLVLLVINLVFTWVVPGIAWQAHVGGLVVGAAVAFGMVHAPRGRRNLVQGVTCAVTLLVIVAMVWARTAVLLG